MRTFGTDPEFMLTKDGEIESAIGIISGTIDNRVSLQGHQFYYDNVMAECAIKPASSKDEMLENVREALQIFSDMAQPYELLPQASHEYRADQLNNEDAQRAGCAPDWCAYRIKQIPPPKQQIRENRLRTCGGHVHLGAEILREDGPHQIFAVYMLDLLLGVPSLWLDTDITSQRRRSLYGQAGRYRVAGPDDNPYGIEYRSLGNFWFKSPKLAALVYDLSMIAVDWSEDGVAEELWDFDLDLFLELQDDFYKAYTPAYDIQQLQDAINTSDKELAAPFLQLVLDRLPNDVAERLHEAFATQTKSLKVEWKLQS